MSRDEFRDSVGFAAGVSYERRRVGEVIRQRISTLRDYGDLGLPANTVGALVAELRLLASAIDEAS